MSFPALQLSRPLLILFLILLAAAAYLALRPADQAAPAPPTGSPTSVLVERPSATHTPSLTPDSSAIAQTGTPITPAAESAAEPSQASETPTQQPTITPTPPRVQEHIVQAGETLDSIALTYNTTAASLSAINFLAEPDLLYPGQPLLIPRYPKPTPALEDLESTIAAAVEAAGSEAAVLGYSVLDRPVELYTFGDGPNTLIFVGGIHGGYEWNSTVLAYEFIDYFTEHPTAVPDAVTAYIIPAANPDGIYAVTGKTGPISATNVIVSDTFPARFNANGVDLNRNWECNWEPSAVWWEEIISGGSSPYSEVENQILLAFIQSQEANLKGVIFWHSSAFLVSPGQCGDDPHQPSVEIASAYATAARYPVGSFNAYPITGEASDSLSSMGIPAFSVELSSHEAIDWVRNLAGIQALFALFS